MSNKINDIEKQIKQVDYNFDSFIISVKNESNNEIRYLSKKIKGNFLKIRKYLIIIENLLEEQEKINKKAFKKK